MKIRNFARAFREIPDIHGDNAGVYLPYNERIELVCVQTRCPASGGAFAKCAGASVPVLRCLAGRLYSGQNLSNYCDGVVECAASPAPSSPSTGPHFIAPSQPTAGEFFTNARIAGC